MSDATDDLDYAESGEQANFRKADKQLWEQQKIHTMLNDAENEDAIGDLDTYLVRQLKGE